MEILWRSNSSISSRTGCPPDIVNEEDHTVEENEFPDFQKWYNPKVILSPSTRLVGLKILFILGTN